MSHGDGTEPVTDEEIVFRRVSEKSGWYDQSCHRPVAWLAFRPNAEDTGGLSVWRAKYKSASQAAAAGARSGNRYFVLRLRAARLREAGVRVEPSPGEGGVGHASLVNVNADEYQRNKNVVRELAQKIADELVERVEGPFGPFKS